MAMSNATGIRPDFGYFDYDFEHALKTHKANEALNFIQHAPPGSTIWLITIIRNFIHQVVSSLFEDLHYNIYGYMEHADAHGQHAIEMLKSWKPKLFEAELETMSRDDLIDHLVEQKLMLPQQFNVDFLKPMIGIDLGNVPFDHDRHHQFVNLRFADEKQINVIGLRYEDLSKWPGILQEYFPRFPSAMPEVQRHGEELIKTKYNELKEYLDGTHFFSALSTEELRAFPNQNYYSDCEIRALANLTDPTTLPPANSITCEAFPTEAPTPFPMDSSPERAVRRKPCPTPIPTLAPTDMATATPTLAPTEMATDMATALPTDMATASPTSATTDMATASPTWATTDTATETTTMFKWVEGQGCYDKNDPALKIDISYCSPTPAPTVHGHWVTTMECKDGQGRTVPEVNCGPVTNGVAFSI
jgi:hypothetical protein